MSSYVGDWLLRRGFFSMLATRDKFPSLLVYQEDENREAPTALRLIEASLRREDVADQTNFR